MDAKTAFPKGDLCENDYLATQRFCHGRKRKYGVPPEEIHLWIKITLKIVVFEVDEMIK